ncbi:MAG TPA: threonine/serine exporter family protein [Chthoniobacterales bacterium]
MPSTLLHLINQTVFGGIAAAGFGVLFNCPPRLITMCFGCGALALAVRTVGLDIGLSLPVASFLAALFLSVVDRTWLRVQSVRGSVIAVVGCIPMVPGSLAARGLKNLFLLFHAAPEGGMLPLTIALESLVIVASTVAAIGTALALPTLLFPVKQHNE